MNRMIKLNVHYSKVAGQTTAQLLAVREMVVEQPVAWSFHQI